MVQAVITPAQNYDLMKNDPPVHETTTDTTTPICPSVRVGVVVVQGITINGAVKFDGHLLVPHCVYAGMSTSTSTASTSTAATPGSDSTAKVQVISTAVITTITVPSNTTISISTVGICVPCVTIHLVLIMPAPPRSPPFGINSCSCVPSSSKPQATLLVSCSRSTSTNTAAYARHHRHMNGTEGGAHRARPKGTGKPEHQATTSRTREAQPRVPTTARHHTRAHSTTGTKDRQTERPAQQGRRSARSAGKRTSTSTGTSTGTYVRSPQ